MQPSLVTLVSGLGWHVQDLLRAAADLDVDLVPIPFTELSAMVGPDGQSLRASTVSLERADGVLVRMMPPGTLEQVVFRMDALHRLEAAGIPVVNAPRAVEAAVDKYLSLSRLQADGIPIPRTIVTERADAALAAFERLGGDVVVKPLFGSEGRGLVRVSEFELARRVFQTLERLGAVLYVQETIRNPGHDLRAFVLDGVVLGAMRRYAPAGDWRTNVALGGRPERCVLSTEQEQIALLAARSIGAVMAGVDLLADTGSGRTVVIEVNAVPGWKALARTTGVDVAAAILDVMRKRLR